MATIPHSGQHEAFQERVSTEQVFLVSNLTFSWFFQPQLVPVQEERENHRLLRQLRELSGRGRHVADFGEHQAAGRAQNQRQQQLVQVELSQRQRRTRTGDDG